MTERKPVEDTFESWVDKQIREATERGEFDNLRGAGKPIPGVGSHVDEHWWIRDYLRREGVPADGLLPDSLVLRRDRERLGERVAECDTEAEVRAEVAALNRRIVAWLQTPTPPHVPIAPVHTEQVVGAWREERARERAARRDSSEASHHRPAETRSSPVTGADVGAGPGWWRALLRVFRRR
ncbi:DnaJ family domain-containing protein [Nocardia higoensis]|uniref:DnaJ family domain-containing protein n=1 Tax=Nocardia higoensis TaxID=228599 RepID=UPI0002FCF940|nr:DUF1992 domain-containing protein [Nocardia higoensis]